MFFLRNVKIKCAVQFWQVSESTQQIYIENKFRLLLHFLCFVNQSFCNVLLITIAIN